MDRNAIGHLLAEARRLTGHREYVIIGNHEMSANFSAIDNLVLGTVNGPWKRDIGVVALVHALKTGDFDGWLVHIATFFGEVRSGLILAFAREHDVSETVLFAAYTKAKILTGEANSHLEADFGQLGHADQHGRCRGHRGGLTHLSRHSRDFLRVLQWTKTKTSPPMKPPFAR